MLNIFIDFQPEDLGRPSTTGNGYTRGSGRVENLTYGYGSGRVVKTVYPQTPTDDPEKLDVDACVRSVVVHRDRHALTRLSLVRLALYLGRRIDFKPLRSRATSAMLSVVTC